MTDDRFVHMIKDAQRVIETEVEIGQVAVVLRCIGQVFHVTNDVVPGITDRAADEGGQSVEMRDAVMKVLSKRIERVIGLRPREPNHRPFRSLPPDHARAAKRRIGISGQEAVSPHLFSADHALEKAGGTAIIQSTKRRHRSQCVAEQTPIDRYKIVLDGKAVEFAGGG